MDGSEQEWSADSIDISNVFEMIADSVNVKEKYSKLFGLENE